MARPLRFVAERRPRSGGTQRGGDVDVDHPGLAQLPPYARAGQQVTDRPADRGEVQGDAAVAKAFAEFGHRMGAVGVGVTDRTRVENHRLQLWMVQGEREQ
jgi:hypothetical protein